MNIRLCGPEDLIHRFNSLLKEFSGKQGKVYSSRNSNDLRLYLNIDDRAAERCINKLNNSLDYILSNEKIGNDKKVINHENNL